MKALVAAIQADRLVLPEFQRDFVWDLSKTHDLFDSVVRDVFIGSLIYGVPSFEITTREIDSRPRKGQGSQRRLGLRTYTKGEIETLRQTGEGFRLILDGQQRITSLYRGLTGADPVWFVAKPLDDWAAGAPLVEALAEFSGKQEKNALSINLTDVWKMVQGEIRREKEKEELLRSSDLLADAELSDQEWSIVFEQYLSVTEQLQDVIKADKLLSYYILDTSVTQFALFFERSNSKGITLSFIDILAAKLYAGFNLRSHVEAFEDDHPTIALNREMVVRMVAYITSDGTEVKKGYILEDLTHEHFTNFWGRATQLYAETVTYLLDNKWLTRQREVPYEGMLLPIMVFLDQLPQRKFSQATAEQIALVRFWWWSSIFSERYAAKTNETTIEDARLLKAVARGEKTIDKGFARRFVSQVQGGDDVMDIRSTTSALFKGVMGLLHSEADGLRDWKNGTVVSSSERVDNHHIFPRRFMEQDYAGPEDDKTLVGSVANRARIPKITNIKIGKKPPSEYLTEIGNDFPDLGGALETHLIGTELVDGAYDGDFFAFLADRAQRIFEIIKRETGDAAETAAAPFLKPTPEVGDAAAEAQGGAET